MQKRPVQEVVLELRLWFGEAGLAYANIADKAKVDLSSVYRVLDPDFSPKQYGSALKAICKIAKIEVEQGNLVGREMPEKIRVAVMRTWDGSDEHAGKLAAAIVAVGGLIRQAMSSK